MLISIMAVVVCTILIVLNNKNSQSDIRGWKVKDQRSKTASH